MAARPAPRALSRRTDWSNVAAGIGLALFLSVPFAAWLASLARDPLGHGGKATWKIDSDITAKINGGGQ